MRKLKDFPQDTKTLVDYTVIYPEIGELLRECEYDFHAGRKMRKLGLVIHNLIEELLAKQEEKIIRLAINRYSEFMEEVWKPYRGSKTCGEVAIEWFKKLNETI